MDINVFLNVLLYSLPALIFVVIFHELGHLILARMTGIGVEVFSIFFGSPIYKFKWKGIQWQIGWLPFGGYCKMKGQEDFGSVDEKQAPDDFYNRPAWTRFLAILGGALFNVILSFIIFVVIYSSQERTLVPNSNIILYPEYQNILNLKDGDVITKIDGYPVQDWGSLMNQFILGIHKEERILTVKRGEQLLDVVYNLDPNIILKKVEQTPYIGFTLPELMFVNSVNEHVMVEEIGKDPYEIISPAKNHLKSGNLVLAIDSNIVLSRYHYYHYMNQNQQEEPIERKITILSLRKGLQILSIEGINFKTLDDIKELILDPKLIEFKVKFIENGVTKEEFFQKKEIFIKPVKMEKLDEQKNLINREYKLGIIAYYSYNPFIYSNLVYKKYNILEAIQKSSSETISTIASVFNQFKLISRLDFDVLRQSVGGPIRILKNIADVAESGFIIYFMFIAKLSIFIGIFNILPIPMLDGGHLLLTVIEMIRRKPLSIKVINIIQYVGLVLMLSLILLITINDIISFL